MDPYFGPFLVPSVGRVVDGIEIVQEVEVEAPGQTEGKRRLVDERMGLEEGHGNRHKVDEGQYDSGHPLFGSKSACPSERAVGVA